MTTEAPSSTIPSPETFSPPTSTPPLETPPPTASSPPPETPPPTPSPPPLESSSPPPATPPLETPPPTPSTPLTPSYDSPPAPPPPDSTSPPAPAPPDSTSPPFASPSLVSPPPPEETPPSMGSTSNPARSYPPSSGSSPRVTGGQSPPLLPSTGNRPPSPPLPPPTGNSPPPPSDSSPISTGVIVSVVISGFAALIFSSFIFFYCKKKRRSASLVPPKDRYDAQASNRQHNAPPAADHVVKVPPHLSPAPIPSRPPKSPSSIQPSHSAPLISSSGGSSSTYSGSENQLHPSQSVPGTPLGVSQITFTYEELAMATNGFSNANLLGQGGFGYVHKGILPNGREVAVKQLKHGSGQGEREFQAEVEIISRVHHKHLVSLVGYCMEGKQRMLVYEFVPNNNLEFHLHGKGRPTIEWPIRMKIALGAAKGLAYLHEDCYPKIIHRDIKASNILLDFKFEAKVADFGLAKFSSDSNTHVSTRVMGTFGYLAPEYASSGKLSEKSDVFSFGVMLLELITGRRPVDTMNSYMDDSLVDWARPLLVRALESNNYDALVDPKLENNYNVNEMTHMISCATACVRHSAKRRPRMSQVLRALEEDSSLDLLHESLRGGPNIDSYGSLDYDSAQYREDMKKFRKAVMSQGVGSSEYSKTSENGANISGSSSKGPQTKEWETGNVK